MVTLTVAEFKRRFSEVLQWIAEGKHVQVTFGRNKKVIGYFSSSNPTGEEFNKPKRKLGLLASKKFSIADDWYMDEQELVDG